MQDLEKELIEKASKGDLEAFEKIYRLNVDFVYRVSLGLLGNKIDAEDITQEVFIKIYKNLKNFKFRSSLKTWIYRITLNTAISAYRRLKKNKIVNYDDKLKVVDIKENSADFGEIESKDILNSLLGKLDYKYRICLILRELEGLSYKEIAEALNININTVRTHLMRARKELLKIKYEV